MADPLFEIFREEAREHLSRLEQGFLDLEQATVLSERAALINELFRHAHSLKGDARAMGLGRVQQAAQVLENVLDDLREKPEHVSRSVIGSGLTQLDEVRRAFEAWQQTVACESDGGEEAGCPPLAGQVCQSRDRAPFSGTPTGNRATGHSRGSCRRLGGDLHRPCSVRSIGSDAGVRW